MHYAIVSANQPYTLKENLWAGPWNSMLVATTAHVEVAGSTPGLWMTFLVYRYAIEHPIKKLIYWKLY